MQLSLDLRGGARPRPTPLRLVAPPRLAAPALAPPEALPESLKSKIARLERATAADWGVVPLGDRRVDGCFPRGGLPRGRWHEIVGEGLEAETPAAATGFAASLARRMARDGAVVWVVQRPDVHAPGLQAFGLGADRVIFVRTANDAETLAVLEDALRTRGVDAAVGEVAAVSLIAGKRLQLACERGGASAFVLRRRLFGAQGVRAGASAATTRWALAPAPSETALPGLGPPRWRTALERCRGGRPGAWIMEAADETGDVRVVAELAHHAADAGDIRASWRAGLRDRSDHRQRPAAGGG